MGDFMSSIIVAGDTSGAITISAPAVAGTNTLTLPASTGTIALTGASVTYSQLPAGSVLQVVNATTTSSTSTSSTSFVTTSFSASITPRFSTSKILASFSGGNFDNNSSSNQAMFATFYRNSTNIGSTSGIPQTKTVTARILSSGAFSVYDSPATTSSTTYTLYIAGEGQTVAFNNSGGLLATITLMEIAA